MAGRCPGLFGYSHMTGGYAGGQAEYVRVPFSDVGPIKIPDGVEDEKVLFLSDILPTGWMAAENCNIQPGDTVAVWGCGPVGLFAIQSAFIMGAEKVIAIDHYPQVGSRLARKLGAQTLNYKDVNVLEALDEITGGRGPDSCIDAVGMEAHGMTMDNVIDTVKTTTKMGTDRPHVFREAVQACRKAGTLSMPGVYGGFADAIPLGAIMQKGLTLRTGQTHVQKYSQKLLDMILEGEDRHDLPDQPPPVARRRSGRLQGLQGEAGRVHQGRAQAALGGQRTTVFIRESFSWERRSVPRCCPENSGGSYGHNKICHVEVKVQQGGKVRKAAPHPAHRPPRPAGDHAC